MPSQNLDTDLTAYCCKIICLVSSPASRKYGVNEQLIFVPPGTLEEATYELILSKKLSGTGYMYFTAFLSYSTGQGYENSLMIWCFISCTCFDYHKLQAHLINMFSPSGNINVALNLIDFVDDILLVTGDKRNDTVQDILWKMQEDAQLWHNLLWCSGRNLKLSKYGYHCIHYTFQENGIQVMRDTVSNDVKLNTTDGQGITIEPKNIYQPWKYLGHFKSPSEMFKMQTDENLKKAMEINVAITKCGATFNEAQIFRNLVWHPALEYTLAQLFLSDTQLQTEIQDEVYNSLSNVQLQNKYHLRHLLWSNQIRRHKFCPHQCFIRF